MLGGGTTSTSDTIQPAAAISYTSIGAICLAQVASVAYRLISSAARAGPLLSSDSEQGVWRHDALLAAGLRHLGVCGPLGDGGRLVAAWPRRREAVRSPAPPPCRPPEPRRTGAPGPARGRRNGPLLCPGAHRVYPDDRVRGERDLGDRAGDT